MYESTFELPLFISRPNIRFYYLSTSATSFRSPLLSASKVVSSTYLMFHTNSSLLQHSQFSRQFFPHSFSWSFLQRHWTIAVTAGSLVTLLFQMGRYVFPPICVLLLMLSCTVSIAARFIRIPESKMCPLLATVSHGIIEGQLQLASYVFNPLTFSHWLI